MWSNTKALLVASFLLIIFGFGFLWFGFQSSDFSPESAPEVLIEQEEPDTLAVLGERAFVSEVVDGDTIKVIMIGKIFTVRYLGIDTPETKHPSKPVECFGKEASAENKNLVEGRSVILQKDTSDTDHYNRLLRYIFLSLEDGQILFVNDYLIREGFARALNYPPDDKYNERFLEAQQRAKEAGLGLWGSC